MPFILPVRLHAKLPMSRFKEVTHRPGPAAEEPAEEPAEAAEAAEAGGEAAGGEAAGGPEASAAAGSSKRVVPVAESAFFLLQKRRRAFRSDKSWLFRVVTKEKTDGVRTKIAVGNDLDSMLDVEWRYITETLPPLVPAQLRGTPRVLWLLAHFTQKALDDGGAGAGVAHDDEEEAAAAAAATTAPGTPSGSAPRRAATERRPSGMASSGSDLSMASAATAPPAAGAAAPASAAPAARPARRAGGHRRASSEASIDLTAAFAGAGGGGGQGGGDDDDDDDAPSPGPVVSQTQHRSTYSRAAHDLLDISGRTPDDNRDRAVSPLVFFDEAPDGTPAVVGAARPAPSAALPRPRAAAAPAAPAPAPAPAPVRTVLAAEEAARRSGGEPEPAVAYVYRPHPGVLLYERQLGRHGWRLHALALAFANLVILTHGKAALLLWLNVIGGVAVWAAHRMRRELAETARAMSAPPAAPPASARAAPARRRGSSKKKKKTVPKKRGGFVPVAEAAAPAEGPTAAALDAVSECDDGVHCPPAAAAGPAPAAAASAAAAAAAADDAKESDPEVDEEEDEEEEDAARPLTVRGTLPRLDNRDETSTHCWSEAPGETFNVRQPRYSVEKKKAPSLKSMCTLQGVDVFRSDTKVSHAGRAVRVPRMSRARRERLGMPETIIVNVMVPDYAPSMWGKKDDGHGWAVVFYYRLTKETVRELLKPDAEMEPAVRLLRDFCAAEEGSPLRGRLKGICRLTNLGDKDLALGSVSKRLVTNYNGTPFLIRTTFSSYPRRHYFEIDVDAHRFGYPALTGLNSLKAMTAHAAFDFGFVVQGESEDELPERMLGAAHLCKLDLARLREWDLPLRDDGLEPDDDFTSDEDDDDEDEDDSCVAAFPDVTVVDADEGGVRQRR